MYKFGRDFYNIYFRSIFKLQSESHPEQATMLTIKLRTYNRIHYKFD